MRICPRCTFPLKVVQDPTNKVELDHCSRCGGNFLEPGDAGKTFGNMAEPGVWLAHKNTMHLGPSKLLSPVNQEPMEAYIVASDSNAVEVDYCKASKGLWLDGKEGQKLVKIMQENNRKSEDEPPTEDEPGLLSYLFQLLTGLPIEAYNPVKKPPIALYTIGGVILACFLLQLFIDPKFSSMSFFSKVGSVPSEIVHGSKIWGLITYAFFHGGFAHILGNLYFFHVFGDNVEDTMGSTNFVLIFFITSALGALAHIVFFPQSSIPLVGASGAISGLMGAYLVLFPNVDVWWVFIVYRMRVPVMVYLLFWIGYQVVMAVISKGGGGVAFLAHIGGFAGGLLLGFLLRKSSPVVQLQQG